MAQKGEPLEKTDKVQVDMRIEQAVNALLDGATVQSVVRSFMAEYGISQQQAYKYTKMAQERIHEKIDENIEQKISKHYKRLERLYKKCLDTGDKRTARMLLKDMADLEGLDAPKRTDITSNGETVQGATIVFADTPPPED
jgi:organic radical activating enzyme